MITVHKGHCEVVFDGLRLQVWLPEAGGPVELDSPVPQALMVLLGAQAQREVARARQRVLAPMRAQTQLQGRFLGGPALRLPAG